jgi:hypothetical protein
MAKKDYWCKTLPFPALIAKISEDTIVNRDDSDGSNVAHAAEGIEPFGKAF